MMTMRNKIDSHNLDIHQGKPLLSLPKQVNDNLLWIQPYEYWLLLLTSMYKYH